VIWLAVLKAVVNPILTFVLVTYVFAMEPLWSQAAVLLSAMPVGVNPYVIAQQYKRRLPCRRLWASGTVHSRRLDPARAGAAVTSAPSSTLSSAPSARLPRFEAVASATHHQHRAHAQKCGDACEELGHRKRLCDVVVRAGLKATHAIALLSPRCQHDEG
jgi:hypothetical protein